MRGFGARVRGFVMRFRGSIFSRNRMCLRDLLGVGAWVFLTALPVEASRQVAVRPPVEMAAAVVPADQSAEVQPPEAKAPRRSFFDILFGRKAAVPEVPEVKMDERMLEAVRVAERSARSRSINRCWRFVKRALKEAELVECYPQTALAKEAAVELPERYGFTQIEVEDPHDAPVGAVIVYGGRGAGHVELRSDTGFVSDHASRKPSPRPLIGVFIKAVDPLEG